MPRHLTINEIIALAPDQASIQPARDASNERKWLTVATGETALWGQAHGSGSAPYQTAVDLTEIAFKCSCPSRKFPCKHGMALLLLFERNPAKFQQGDTPPEWVSQWLEKRNASKEPKLQSGSAARTSDPAKDELKSAKKFSNVAEGLAELRTWLNDVIRQGLAEIPSKGYSFWDSIAARMVDAGAPGAARLLREMAGIAATGPGWQQRLLRRIVLLHLLTEGFTNRETLPDTVVSDIKTTLGWTINQEDLFLLDGIHDQWQVLGQRFVEEDRIRARRSWIVSARSNEIALLLHFAHGNTAFPIPLSTGTAMDAEIVHYPSAYPQRGALKSYSFTDNFSFSQLVSLSILENLCRYSSAVSAQPWLERYPFILRSVVPIQSGSEWYVIDNDSNILPLSQNFDRPWYLLAQSGLKPIDVFGEWDGDSFWPLSVITQEGLVNI